LPRVITAVALTHCMASAFRKALWLGNLGLFCLERVQIKTETRPTQGGIVVGANTAAMCFDNGSTDRQTQTHAGVFGREEVIKQMRQVYRINPRTAIFNGATHSPRVR